MDYVKATSDPVAAVRDVNSALFVNFQCNGTVFGGIKVLANEARVDISFGPNGVSILNPT